MEMKVKCVGYKPHAANNFTKNKVYTWKDNTLKSDTGFVYTTFVLGTDPNNWKLSDYYDFEKVDADSNINDTKSFTITIESDGVKNVIAIKKNADGKQIACGFARCCPEDKFDANYGVQLAIDRMNVNEEANKKKEYKVSVGDCVYINDKPNVSYAQDKNCQYLLVGKDDEKFFYCIPLDGHHNYMLTSYINDGINQHFNCYSFLREWIDFEKTYENK